MLPEAVSTVAMGWAERPFSLTLLVPPNFGLLKHFFGTARNDKTIDKDAKRTITFNPPP